MTKQELKFLKNISEIDGVSGHEKEVREFMKKEFLTVLPEENLSYDRLGSIIAKKEGLAGGPKILITGHMDEIGMIVTQITDDGFLKFQTIGGWWSQVMSSQKYTITASNGKKIRAVIGSIPPHILQKEQLLKPVDVKDMFMDIGVKDKESAEKLGIKIGDPITPYTTFEQMGDDNYLLGKAWDDRIGCAIAIEVIKGLKDVEHPNVVYSAGTVQEEVGCRGAKTVAQMVNPDIAIALDTGIAYDIPGTDGHIKIGNGPVMLIFDGGLIGHLELREQMMKVADELKIPYQLDHLQRGGTDASQMHVAHDGAPSMSFIVATRYLHAHTSVIHYDDYKNAVKIIIEFIKRLDKDMVNAITYN
ncbi:MAG TPA: M42 family metallopeptidase [Acholeplasmataceae bacterium]|nr:M42 family metallopeptidase [Acholeplasmataceae bacterium]